MAEKRRFMSMTSRYLDSMSREAPSLMVRQRLNFWMKISCFLRLASDNLPFLRPVVVNRFTTVALK